MNNSVLWFMGVLFCVIFSILTPFLYNILFVIMMFFMIYGTYHSEQQDKIKRTEKIEIGDDDFAYLVFEKGEIYTNLIKKPAGRYKGKNFKISIKVDKLKKVGKILN